MNYEFQSENYISEGLNQQRRLRLPEFKLSRGSRYPTGPLCKHGHIYKDQDGRVIYTTDSASHGEEEEKFS